MARCGVFHRIIAEESRGPRGGAITHYQAECIGCGRKTDPIRITSDSMGRERSLAALHEHQCPTPPVVSAQGLLLNGLAKYIEDEEPIPLTFAIEHFGDRTPEDALRLAWSKCVEGHALGALMYALRQKVSCESAPRYSQDRATTFVSFNCGNVSYQLRGTDANVADAVRGIVDAEKLIAGTLRRCFKPAVG